MQQNTYGGSLDAKVLDWVMGYLPNWEDFLGVDLEQPENNRERKILDYGCATGQSAKYLKGLGLEEVVGVDINSDRIVQAGLTPEGVIFEVIEDRINYENGHFDGAMANFVFSTIETEEYQKMALAEIHRVLMPDSPFVMVNNNPSATGIKFTSIQSGEPSISYQPGHRIPIWYLREGRAYESDEIWWPQEHYERLMKDTGFKDVRTVSEKLGDRHLRIMQQLGVNPNLFDNERRIAPYISIVGYR